MANSKYADGICDCCGLTVVWRVTDRGALSYFCAHCDLQVHAKSGTEAARLIAGMVKKPVPKVGNSTDTLPTPEKPNNEQPARKAGMLLG